MDNLIKEKSNLLKVLFVLAIIGSVYFAVRALAEIRSYGRMGSSEVSTITLSGHGEVKAVPDVATIYFTVLSSKTTQKEASDEVNAKTKRILDFLKSSGVLDKDIKTQDYSSSPRYSNPTPCPLYFDKIGTMPPCRGGESKIIGYGVSQSINVKIRKVDDVSKIVDGINAIGVTNMNGPNFAIDDEDGLKAQARKAAIDDAKVKAKVLAGDLGMRLGKVVTFSESGNYYPMYAKGMMADSASVSSAPAELPKGENTISSDVTITYEIR